MSVSWCRTPTTIACCSSVLYFEPGQQQLLEGRSGQPDEFVAFDAATAAALSNKDTLAIVESDALGLMRDSPNDAPAPIASTSSNERLTSCGRLPASESS